MVRLAFLLVMATSVALADPPPDDYQKLDKVLSFLRKRNAEQYAMPKEGIDEGRFVTVGGIDQWITIRGRDRANPVLLFVHGGPADVTNPWSFATASSSPSSCASSSARTRSCSSATPSARS